jgi:hypothetical protein
MAYAQPAGQNQMMGGMLSMMGGLMNMMGAAFGQKQQQQPVYMVPPGVNLQQQAMGPGGAMYAVHQQGFMQTVPNPVGRGFAVQQRQQQQAATAGGGIMYAQQQAVQTHTAGTGHAQSAVHQA